MERSLFNHRYVLCKILDDPRRTHASHLFPSMRSTDGQDFGSASYTGLDTTWRIFEYDTVLDRLVELVCACQISKWAEVSNIDTRIAENRAYGSG